MGNFERNFHGSDHHLINYPETDTSLPGIKPRPPASQAGIISKSCWKVYEKSLRNYLKTPALWCFRGFLSIFLVLFCNDDFLNIFKTIKKRKKRKKEKKLGHVVVPVDKNTNAPLILIVCDFIVLFAGKTYNRRLLEVFWGNLDFLDPKIACHCAQDNLGVKKVLAPQKPLEITRIKNNLYIARLEPAVQ